MGMRAEARLRRAWRRRSVGGGVDAVVGAEGGAGDVGRGFAGVLERVVVDLRVAGVAGGHGSVGGGRAGIALGARGRRAGRGRYRRHRGAGGRRRGRNGGSLRQRVDGRSSAPVLREGVITSDKIRSLRSGLR